MPGQKIIVIILVWLFSSCHITPVISATVTVRAPTSSLLSCKCHILRNFSDVVWYLYSPTLNHNAWTGNSELCRHRMARMELWSCITRNGTGVNYVCNSSPNSGFLSLCQVTSRTWKILYDSVCLTGVWSTFLTLKNKEKRIEYISLSLLTMTLHLKRQQIPNKAIPCTLSQIWVIALGTSRPLNSISFACCL